MNRGTITYEKSLSIYTTEKKIQASNVLYQKKYIIKNRKKGTLWRVWRSISSKWEDLTLRFFFHQLSDTGTFDPLQIHGVKSKWDFLMNYWKCSFGRTLNWL